MTREITAAGILSEPGTRITHLVSRCRQHLSLISRALFGTRSSMTSPWTQLNEVIRIVDALQSRSTDKCVRLAGIKVTQAW